MRTKKIKPRYTQIPKYLFNSPFEERKALEYLHNLINSTFLHHKTTELFGLSVALLGRKPIIVAMNKVCPAFLESDEFRYWMERNNDLDALSSKTKEVLLTGQISTLLSKRINFLVGGRGTLLENRLKTIQASFDFNSVEIELLLFLFLKETVSALDNPFCNDHHGIADFGCIQRLRSRGHIVLGVGRAALHRIFVGDGLRKAQVLEWSGRDSISVAPWCIEYLSGMGRQDLSSEFYSRKNDEPLEVDDFDIAKDELSVLDTVMKGRKGKNILFYGVPGAGKTSFAGSLARKYGKELLSVKVPESGEHTDRLRAVYATVNLADESKALVLVDEADEILNTSNSSRFNSVTQKSWINTLLDTHGKKIIWITNRSDQIDTSTMRRFSFSMEFKKVDQAKRMKVLAYELEKNGIDREYFSEEELKDLCAGHAVDAGGIVNAVRTAAINKATKKETAIRKIKTILRNHEKATNGRSTSSIRERTFDAYSLQSLNTSLDLAGITSSLQQDANGNHAKSPNAVSLLLYGMPGTGKTEYVYYLGHILRKEVVLKRASEIQSKWVGETEKNIAAAFSDAGSRGGILFFDEADSFLYPRKDARQSWEKSFTNEILTQLENFKGIVVFATNDIDGLDHAAFRRFRFKVRFDPLTPEGNLLLYYQLMKPLVTNNRAITGDEIERLKGISNLTPGDYSVVKDQYAFLQNMAITHDMVLNALTNEAMHKKGSILRIGF